MAADGVGANAMSATMPTIEVLGFVRNPPVAAVAGKWCHEIAIQIVARLGCSGKNHLHGEDCWRKGKAMERASSAASGTDAALVCVTNAAMALDVIEAGPFAVIVAAVEAAAVGTSIGAVEFCCSQKGETLVKKKVRGKLRCKAVTVIRAFKRG